MKDKTQAHQESIMSVVLNKTSCCGLGLMELLRSWGASVHLHTCTDQGSIYPVSATYEDNKWAVGWDLMSETTCYLPLQKLHMCHGITSN